jgi:hypothetical protein
VAETTDNLRFHHALSSKSKLRTYASFIAQATSWTRPHKVAARLECLLQPVAGEGTATGTRQEVDIYYFVPLLKGSAQHLYHLYANGHCHRGAGEPHQTAQGKFGVGSHVMSRCGDQARRPADRRILADAQQARRHPAGRPAGTAEFATIHERLISGDSDFYCA